MAATDNTATDSHSSSNLDASQNNVQEQNEQQDKDIGKIEFFPSTRKKRFMKFLALSAKKHAATIGEHKRKAFVSKIDTLRHIEDVDQLHHEEKIIPNEHRELKDIEKKIARILEYEYNEKTDDAFRTRLLSAVSEKEEENAHTLHSIEEKMTAVGEIRQRLAMLQQYVTKHVELQNKTILQKEHNIEQLSSDKKKYEQQVKDIKHELITLKKDLKLAQLALNKELTSKEELEKKLLAAKQRATKAKKTASNTAAAKKKRTTKSSTNKSSTASSATKKAKSTTKNSTKSSSTKTTKTSKTRSSAQDRNRLF